MTHDHAREALSHVGQARTGAETDRAAARLADDLDTHAAPPPAKAADPDGWDYYADTQVNWMYRHRGGLVEWTERTDPTRFEVSAATVCFLVSRYAFGPATRLECERFLGWPKGNPDDHGDNGQARATAGATAARMVERVGTIPTCAACGSAKPTDYREMPPVNPDGSGTFTPGYRPMPYDPAAAPRFNVTDAPKPTDATGADIVREYLRLSIVWNEKGAGLIGPAGDEAWYTARNRAAYDVTQFLGANLPALRAALGGV